MEDKVLTSQDYEEAAHQLAVDVPAIRAVVSVESSGSGFRSDGRPKILFEGHVFWKQLKSIGVNPHEWLEDTPALEYTLYPTWGATLSLADGEKVLCRKVAYRMNQYDQLGKAIDVLAAHGFPDDAALSSASWGLFQIMGFNYAVCGYSSVQAFVEAHYESEGKQLMAFTGFVRANPAMYAALKAHDWATFAAKYNGPGYKSHAYDEKLARAYNDAVAAFR